MPEDSLKEPNRLIDEKSPYLLQHAYNPVKWYPWSEEAFAKAADEDKPIFLSIGYSTCHWCHVMAHESFEDEEVAQLLNENFINIKVDREERPDIDKVYMMVAQMMTGRGGWPLTIIMTPEKEPFYADTYIPKISRYGKMGLIDLIPRIRHLWDTDRENISEVTQQVMQALKASGETSEGALDRSVLEAAYEIFTARFDKSRGGFGTAPKFPSPHNLMLLMRFWKRTGDKDALSMVFKTLDAMRAGGIYDQIGFGFHRYSTDASWLLPHFEKMLYDQAMHLMAYTEAYQISKNEKYRSVVYEIVEYLKRDLRSPEGAFYSAEDADSEGEEGKFYVWSKEEILNILPPNEANAIIAYYGFTDEGNFLEEATGKRIGKNIAYVAKEGELSNEEKETLETARKKLLAARSRRVRPHLDDKILADWNALLIAALAKAGRVFDDDDITTQAEEALRFINQNMHDSSGKLLHSYRQGEANVPAFLDDYAFMTWALLEVYETTFEVHLLQQALNYIDILIDEFWDPMKGGFFFSGIHDERVLTRQSDAYDGAMPSGNSVAMYCLIRLGRALGRPDLEERALKVAERFSGIIKRAPTGFGMLLIALDFANGPTSEVIITGDENDSSTKEMLRFLAAEYLPHATVLYRGTQSQKKALNNLAQYTRYHEPIRHSTTAFVCVDQNCQLPTTDVQQMISMLQDFS